MFISTNVYFRRIMDALENVIAPEVESDHVRGQVFAVVDLINQISDRVEYKHDHIEDDIKQGSKMIMQIAEALSEAGGQTPEEIEAFLKAFDEGSAGRGLALRKKVEETLCAAIDYFHENKNKMESNAAEKLDSDIRQHIFKNAGRDLGLMKPPMIEKISRPQKT